MLLIIILCFIPPVYGDESDSISEVRIASFSFPPLLHGTASGVFSGTMGETVKALCKAGQLNCQFSVLPLKRAYQDIKRGRVDALITINAGQLDECCIASEWSSPWSAGLFALDSSAIPESQDELIGKSLIIVGSMKSPYIFAKDLDALSTSGKLKLIKAPNIETSVKMFIHKRASLLWGGEDFKWYFGKINANVAYRFKPLFTKPVVVWVRKDKPKVLEMLNLALKQLENSGSLDSNHLLSPNLMKQRYIDAPFNQ